MFLKSASGQNILSYGNTPVKYQLDKTNMTLITGLNGMGKSSLIDIITFCLYGKPFRELKKLEFIINKNNKKGLMTEVELIGNNRKNVLVRRGLKPSVFEIYEDGVLVKQNAKSKDYQVYLEQNIIGMTFNTFIQTVIISKTRYTPFMKLKSAERRQFVESMLNIEIFGDMLKLQTSALKTLNERKSEIEFEHRVTKSSLDTNAEEYRRYKATIEKIKSESEETTKSQITSLQESIESTSRNIEKLKANIRDLSSYTESVERLEKLRRGVMTTRIKIDNINSDINKLRSTKDTCHTCGSKVDISHIEGHIKEKTIERDRLSAAVTKATATIDELSEVESKLNEDKRFNTAVENKIFQFETAVRDYNNSIKTLQSKKFDTSGYDKELEAIVEQGKNNREKLSLLSDDLGHLLKSIDNNKFALSLLKDSGIKASIIENSIGSINKTINEYLHKFGFYINFYLDSEFNETIVDRGSDYLLYNNYSEGEKLRIDLALILAWRELSLKQSGLSCNLLFFDEIVDASMDNEGVELFAKALQALSNTNTWIITHTPEKIEAYVRGYIRVEKLDQFTILTTNK